MNSSKESDTPPPKFDPWEVQYLFFVCVILIGYLLFRFLQNRAVGETGWSISNPHGWV